MRAATLAPIASIAIATLVGLAVPVPKIAEPGSEVYIDVEIGELEQLTDSLGRSLSVTSDSVDENDNRKIVGVTVDGAPFEVTVYEGLASDANSYPEAITPPATGVPEVLAVATTASTVSASWRISDQTVSSSLTFDGLVNNVQQGNQFHQTNLEPATPYALEIQITDRYEVAIAQAEVSTDGRIRLLSEGNFTNQQTTHRDIRSSLLVTATTLDSVVDSLRGNPNRISDVNPTESSSLVYRTFIPYETIRGGGNELDRLIESTCIAAAKEADLTLQEAGPSIVTEYEASELTFKGDNRDFSDPDETSSFRTEVRLDVNWSGNQGLPDYAQQVSVGETQVVSVEDHEDVVASRVADTSNISVVSLGQHASVNQLVFDIDHRANDPFCPAIYGETPYAPSLGIGTIQYRAVVMMNRSGFVQVRNIHATMPSHEIYIKWNDDEWSTAFTSRATNLSCLVLHSLQAPIVMVFGVEYTCTGQADVAVQRTKERWLRMLPNSSPPSAYGGTFGYTTGKRFVGQGAATLLPPMGGGSGACWTREFAAGPRLPVGVIPGEIHSSYVGGLAALTLGSDNHIYTWGPSGRAILGRANEENLLPDRVNALSYVDLEVVGGTALAVDDDGSIWTWGQAIDSNAGDAFGRLWEPSLLSSSDDVVDVEYEFANVIALTADGGVIEYRPEYDEMTGVAIWSWQAVTDPTLTMIDIGVKFDTYFAVQDDGSLWRWGGSDGPRAESDDDADPYAWLDSPSRIITDDDFLETDGHLFTRSDGARLINPGWGNLLDSASLRDNPPVALDHFGLDMDGRMWTETQDDSGAFVWDVVPGPPTILSTSSSAQIMCDEFSRTLRP